MVTTDAPIGRSPRSLRTRLVAVVGCAAIGAAGLGLSSASAGAQTTGATPTEAAGSWLADQFVDGERFEVVFGEDTFADYGGTVDATIALAAAGVADDTAAAATDWLEESVQTDAYAGDGTTSNQSGGLAKLALLAQTRGLDAHSWGEGSVDLIQRLVDMEDGAGRFVDTPDFGDDFKTFSHAFAIVALARQGDAAPSDSSVDLLLASQCADGGFDGDLDEDPGDCESGVDSTATALMALLAVDRADDAEEIASAVAHLESVQADDGGFATGPGGTPNGNSTGLAAYVLELAGATTAAADADAFLLSLQQDCDAPESDRGAIAFDASGFSAGTAPRATAQAIFGLTGTGYIEASSAGATIEQPRFECPVPVDPTIPAEPAPTTTVTVAGTGQAPAATPTRANPDFTG